MIQSTSFNFEFHFILKTHFSPLLSESKTTIDSKMEGPEEANFQIFRDCLSTPLIEKSSTQPAKKSRKTRGNGRRKTVINTVSIEAKEPNDAEELAEFVDVGAA
jgi:hypothetical protein